MKKILARIISEIFYYFGHWVSFPMHWFDSAWLFSIYSKLMCWSCDIQNWASNESPWRKENEPTTI